MKKIDIIIPCFNAENYIERCLVALEQQKYKDFSVIVVDDCSSDNTVNVIEKFNDKSDLDIKIFKNEQNSGPAKSRNLGIKMADSEFVAFCDADDWYEEDFLGNLLNILEKYDASIAIGGYQIVNENGKIEKRSISEEEKVLNFEQACMLESDSLCMLLVKTSVIKEVMIPDIRNGEDMATVPILYSKSERIAVSNKCNYNYYRRTGSASQKPNMMVVDSIIKSFSFVEKKLPAGYLDELEYLGIKNMLYPSIISLFTFSFDIDKANEIINSFEKKYATWEKNKYWKYLPRYKKVVLKLLKCRRYYLLRMVATLRSKMVNS